MRLIPSLLFLLLAASLPAQDTRPNIIYILADDLGYGDLGCYGQKALTTPNLDRMAAEGMRFTRHYSGSTVCAPSRAVLMSGLHSGHASVRGNGPGQLLKRTEPTVAKLLRDAGYKTGCAGKWGIGNPPPLDDPLQMGFDYFYGYVNMMHAHNFYPEFLYRNGQPVKLRNVLKEAWKNQPAEKEGVGVAATKRDYAPVLIANEALDFIDRNQEHPFFLFFAMNVPHANNEAGNDPEQKNGMEVPSLGEFAEKPWPAPEKGFAAMIRNLDKDVGRVLDKLRELKLDGKTLVIFSSDNGPHEEGGHSVDHFDSNGPLRGTKRDLYEGGVRVPMIAWWPGVIEAGKESALISGFQDFLPTCAALAGVPVPPNRDGISLVPTLRGQPEATQEEHSYLYWEFQEQGGRRALLSGDWKLVLHGTNQDWDRGQTRELFNLTDDAAEAHDIAENHPEMVESMLVLMKEAHKPQ